MKHLVFCLSLLILAISTSPGQQIAVRTYPILAEDSFLPLPSTYGSMGNVSVAVFDDQRDPFTNPATLLRIPGTTLRAFVLPRFSSWNVRMNNVYTSAPHPTSFWSSENLEKASNTYAPIGIVSKSSTGALAVLGSYHRTSSREEQRWFSEGSSSSPLDTRSYGAENTVFTAGGAVLIPVVNIAVGAGYTHANINGVDGMLSLYPNSKSISLRGALNEYRMGLSASFLGEDHAALLAGYSSVDIHQRAEYEFASPVENEDKNDTWYLQFNYRLPVTDRLTFGVLGLGNWRTQPKLPDYPVSGIPRDPGKTIAYNFGAGMSLRTSGALLAVEYIVEPIDCRTWVDALQDRDRGDGVIVVRAGEKERENNYSFSNQVLRGGTEIEAASWLRFQIGAQARFVRYDYVNRNFVWGTEQRTTPQMRWQEVTLTGGLQLEVGAFYVQYGAEVLTGRGLIERMWWPMMWDAVRANDFILPPTGLVSIRSTAVVTHQLVLRYSLAVTD